MCVCVCVCVCVCMCVCRSFGEVLIIVEVKKLKHGTSCSLNKLGLVPFTKIANELKQTWLSSFHHYLISLNKFWQTWLKCTFIIWLEKHYLWWAIVSLYMYNIDYVMVKGENLLNGECTSWFSNLGWFWIGPLRWSCLTCMGSVQWDGNSVVEPGITNHNKLEPVAENDTQPKFCSIACWQQSQLVK